MGEPDYIAPTTVIQTPFTCAPADDYVDNLSKLCDGVLERRIERALAAPPADAPAPGLPPITASATSRRRCR